MKSWKPTYVYATYDEYLSMCAFMPQIWGNKIQSVQSCLDAGEFWFQMNKKDARVRLIDDSKTTESVHLSQIDCLEVRVK